jgi:hypothetical protein
MLFKYSTFARIGWKIKLEYYKLNELFFNSFSFNKQLKKTIKPINIYIYI